jgi:hypothetical protein
LNHNQSGYARTRLTIQAIGHEGDNVRFWQILLQKSKVASVRFFGELFERNVTDDSYNLSRAAEIACEFGVRR